MYRYLKKSNHNKIFLHNKQIMLNRMYEDFFVEKCTLRKICGA